MKKPPLPPELLATRPALEFDENAEHPSNGVPLGPSPKNYSIGLKDHIVSMIKKGQRPKTAAGIAGITEATFQRWMKLGREGHPHLWEFYQEVNQAEAIAEGTAIDAITGGDGTYKMTSPENAKWLLERRFASAYSKDVQLKVNAGIEEFMQRVEERLSIEVTQSMVGKNLYQDLVILALAGEDIVDRKPMFILNGREEEIVDDEPVGSGDRESTEDDYREA